jgi:hypothetical protein
MICMPASRLLLLAGSDEPLERVFADRREQREAAVVEPPDEPLLDE